MATSKSNAATIMLATDNILASAATQVRKKLDKTTIEEYIQALANGAQFPALVVFAEKDSERYILADGFHRLHAYINAEAGECEVEVHEGSLHDALMWALGANVPMPTSATLSRWRSRIPRSRSWN